MFNEDVEGVQHIVKHFNLVRVLSRVCVRVLEYSKMISKFYFFL
jgi:hypothetical protein